MDFVVVNLAGTDGTAVMSAIDNLSAQGAKGFLICPPDERLGPAIYARAAGANMKVVSVDDQFVTPEGKPMPQVPHLGMSGYKIGQQVGGAISDEMKRLGWKPEEVAACRITSNELPTARERVAGATDTLLQNGFNKANIFDAPQRTTDTEGANVASVSGPRRHPAAGRDVRSLEDRPKGVGIALGSALAAASAAYHTLRADMKGIE